MSAREFEPLLRVAELSDWAAEDGDPDVLQLCHRALSGDTTAEQEALDWWRQWSRDRVAMEEVDDQELETRHHCRTCGRQVFGEGHTCPEEST